MMDSNELRAEIIKAGRRAVEELIKVAKESIVGLDMEDDLAADKLKNAAAAKKLAIFDAFEILSRIDSEEDNLKENSGEVINQKKSSGGFAEKRASGK
jgi:hypothetical protein|tara:strand:- start:110 stop:403 length:294 start_codon:yes stop_codon:yes gene_type:complete